MAHSPGQAAASSPERNAKRGRMPSPVRMVDVGRVAHPRVGMNDGSPQGVAAAGERQRQADESFFS